MAAAATGLLRCSCCISKASGASKLIGWECYCAEERAGIVVVCSTCAFLIGYTVIGCINKELRWTYHSDYGEDAKGYENSWACACGYKLITERGADAVGDIDIFVATAGTMAITVGYTGCQYNGLNGFYDGGRIVCRCGIGIAAATVGICRT